MKRLMSACLLNLLFCVPVFAQQGHNIDFGEIWWTARANGKAELLKNNLHVAGSPDNEFDENPTNDYGKTEGFFFAYALAEAAYNGGFSKASPICFVSVRSAQPFISSHFGFDNIIDLNPLVNNPNVFLGKANSQGQAMAWRNFKVNDPEAGNENVWEAEIRFEFLDYSQDTSISSDLQAVVGSSFGVNSNTETVLRAAYKGNNRWDIEGTLYKKDAAGNVVETTVFDTMNWGDPPKVFTAAAVINLEDNCHCQTWALGNGRYSFDWIFEYLKSQATTDNISGLDEDVDEAFAGIVELEIISVTTKQ